eukprot:TRINITY_DN21538_c0_g1_i3.p2 TRINITY_DN21538_c0_g1~~TRINITY_DN21538_c0_g1_i3.p2  ORF type:complete len:125 (-),score=11.90 TRINITY_DN21538_c0_g1_i3:253-627(-)
MLRSLVGSEMCIRDSDNPVFSGALSNSFHSPALRSSSAEPMSTSDDGLREHSDWVGPVVVERKQGTSFSNRASSSWWPSAAVGSLRCPHRKLALVQPLVALVQPVAVALEATRGVLRGRGRTAE